MSSPLKSVSVEEMENAIAKTLQELAQAKGFTVSIAELKFSSSSGRTDVSLSVWDNSFADDPFGFDAAA